MPTGFFDSELSRLNASINQMGQAVKDMLASAVLALQTLDTDLALKTIDMDLAINDYDNKITNKTILLIATNQPVACDLRFLAASLRLASELERIADLAANVAKRARGLAALKTQLKIPDELTSLAALTKNMLDNALLALAQQDQKKAREIINFDIQLDRLNHLIRQNIVDSIAKNGSLVHWGLEIIYAAAHLERLGDHITNVAEDVIYISSGQNIRHCDKCEARTELSLPATLAEGHRGNRDDVDD